MRSRRAAGEKRQDPKTVWIFEGNRASVHHEEAEDGRPKDLDFHPVATEPVLDAAFRLDPNPENPRSEDATKGLEPGKVTPAIYKLEGDTLTICYINYYDKGKRPELHR